MEQTSKRATMMTDQVFAEAVMHKFYRDSGWVKRRRLARRRPEFRLGAAEPIVDLPKAG
jgi:hypothetical protein